MNPFPIKSGVKEGCILAPTLYSIFFPLVLMVLRYAFCESEDGIFLHTRSHSNLLNLTHLRAKTKVHIRELLFADDATLAVHSEALQRFMTRFAVACSEFALTISLKKTNTMAQDISVDVVENFTYLGSTISNNLSLDAEANVRIGKAATAMARLAKRVRDSTMLTLNIKMRVYKACVLSTLLYGSEIWTLYQERRLNAFHMRNLRRLLGITWQDQVTNASILSQTGMPSMFAILTQRCLRWLGHMCRTEDIVASQRTSCMESSPEEHDHLASPPYATRIPARET